ncbi:MAG: hypothetical protein IKT01_00510 [Eubacteriaceae bacterium]|nr:hypothetical protein [Eubacteriaceae bacterium]
MEYNDRIAHLCEEGMQAVRSGDWDKVERIASYNADIGYYMIKMYENILPLEVKCRIALFHYTDKGDFNPTIRKYVEKPESSVRITGGICCPHLSEQWIHLLFIAAAERILIKQHILCHGHCRRRWRNGL